MHYQRCFDVVEFQEFYSRHAQEIKEKKDFETSLVVGPEFTVAGFCEVCQSKARFRVDLQYGGVPDDPPRPNWRERLVCVHCGLNNRLRAALSLMKRRAKPDDNVFITEQNACVSVAAKSMFRDPFCSDYLTTRNFQTAEDELIYESKEFKRLTGDKFDAVGCFDILSGPIDSRNFILLKLTDVMADGAKLFLTTPLNLAEEGMDEHVVSKSPPYRWDLLEFLRLIGFHDVGVEPYWSEDLAYLGFPQLIITATHR